MELAQLLILVGHGHALQVANVSYCLEVATDNEEVDFVVVSLFKGGNLTVDGVERAVTTSFDRDLYRQRSGKGATFTNCKPTFITSSIEPHARYSQSLKLKTPTKINV